jgi:hypothetical protein
MQDAFLTSSEVLDSLEVTNPNTALFLADMQKARHLFPFLGKECSLGEAAKQLKTSIAKLRYWVTKMEEYGLVKQTRIEKRKGSPIKYYRSVAKEFMFPIELLPVGSDVAMLEHREKPIYQRAFAALAKTGRKNIKEWYVKVFQTHEGGMHGIYPKTLTLEDAKIINYWWKYRLTLEQAQSFRDELTRLRLHYHKLSEANPEATDSYLSHLLLVQDS